MFKKKSRAYQSGFTLIELMIVIAIIGILAAILTPIMMRARLKAYHTACVQNERNIGTALELYSLEYKQLFPPDLDLLASGSDPYIRTIEVCPSDSTSYTAGYTAATDFKTYLLECPGSHYLQLPGLVEATYPQIANGILNQYRADN